MPASPGTHRETPARVRCPQALSEEKVAYDRSPSKNIYLNVAVNTLKKLRGLVPNAVPSLSSEHPPPPAWPLLAVNTLGGANGCSAVASSKQEARGALSSGEGEGGEAGVSLPPREPALRWQLAHHPTFSRSPGPRLH